jgi:hypothetical protein
MEEDIPRIENALIDPAERTDFASADVIIGYDRAAGSPSVDLWPRDSRANPQDQEARTPNH